MFSSFIWLSSPWKLFRMNPLIFLLQGLSAVKLQGGRMAWKCSANRTIGVNRFGLTAQAFGAASRIKVYDTNEITPPTIPYSLSFPPSLPLVITSKCSSRNLYDWLTDSRRFSYYLIPPPSPILIFRLGSQGRKIKFTCRKIARLDLALQMDWAWLAMCVCPIGSVIVILWADCGALEDTISLNSPLS